MGLPEHTVTKISSAQIRTTHMTGVITDLGIELGKMLYWNSSASARRPAGARRTSACACSCRAAGHVLVGSIASAAGFKHVGFVLSLPLALVLFALALPPVIAAPLRPAPPRPRPPAAGQNPPPAH